MARRAQEQLERAHEQFRVHDSDRYWKSRCHRHTVRCYADRVRRRGRSLAKFAFGLPGMLPADYWISSAVVIVASGPVAALQSGLSTVMRSFAAPVAMGLIVTCASTMLLLVRVKAEFVSPHALVTQATQLGTTLASGEGTSFEAAPLTSASVMLLLVIAVVMTVLIIAGTAARLNRSDTRS